MDNIIKKTLENLEKNNMPSYYVETKAEIIPLLKTFIEKGGQIFQGNTTPLEDLLKAKENPEMYQHLIVRVGGYSARFVNLDPKLQDDIINRIRHCR